MDIRKTIIVAGAVIYLFAGGLYAANIKLIGPCFEKPVLEKDFGSWKNRKCFEYFNDRSDVLIVWLTPS